MNPGRELDALVAEKVMGWTDVQVVNDPPFNTTMGRTVIHGELYRFNVPNYSTNIEAAWEVVEKVTQFLRYNRKEYFPIIHQYDGQWHCGWSWSYMDCAEYESKSDSAPHVICLAALKAMGVKL